MSPTLFVLDGAPVQTNIRRAAHQDHRSAFSGAPRRMMMAPDSTPDEPDLSPAAIDALRTALEKYLVDTNEVTTLHPALRRIAGEAREKKMRAEVLLVLLKDLWFALPQIRRMPEGGNQNRLLQRVVTLCIREYYST